MTQKSLSFLMTVLFFCSCLYLSFLPFSHAGDYHLSEDTNLRCADCHTVHYSEGGSVPNEWGQGGSCRLLLKKEVVSELCLMCHDGSDEDAPKVETPSYLSSAGAFATGGEITESNRHTIGETSTPPGYTGTWDPNTPLTCTSCHDPHNVIQNNMTYQLSYFK